MNHALQLNLAFQQAQEMVIDVLFVTNQRHIPACIEQILGKNNLCWARACVDEFSTVIGQIKLMGPVIVDTTEVGAGQRNTFIQTLLELDRGDTGIILLNNSIDIPLGMFKLADILTSARSDEVWGRIQTHITYRKLLIDNQNAQTVEASGASAIQEHLKMAGQVQRNFLPKHLPSCNKFNWAVLFKPAEWVSGDIYDITRLDETHIGFYLADAVGHSMPAALLTMFLKHAIVMRQTQGNEYHIFQPAEVITNLNTKMVDQKLTGCLFATCCYCLLDTETRRLTYARAGHPYPVLIRKNSRPRQLQNYGGLLGVFENSTFEQKSIRLRKGDKFFIYSDGCDNLVGKANPDGNFEFNEDFCSIAGLPAGQMLEHLEELGGKWKTNPATADDITAIGLEIL